MLHTQLALGLLTLALSAPVSYTHLDVYKRQRWQSLRRLRQSQAFKDSEDPAIADELKGPEVEIFVIDVSFAALKDKAEFDYLNGLPTSCLLYTSRCV